MVRDLEDYLKSDVIYWHVAEPNPLGSHMPQLTIGALLEALSASRGCWRRRPAAVAATRAQHDRIRAAHPALYVRKAMHELHGRLDAWQANLEDAERKTKVFYAQDVRVRAKIYLLERTLGADVPIELQHYRERTRSRSV